jgi:hypothetical protein
MTKGEFIYFVGLVALISFLIAHGCEKRAACHKAGGIVVYGGTCVKSEGVIEVK